MTIFSMNPFVKKSLNYSVNTHKQQQINIKSKQQVYVRRREKRRGGAT